MYLIDTYSFNDWKRYRNYIIIFVGSKHSMNLFNIEQIGDTYQKIFSLFGKCSSHDICFLRWKLFKIWISIEKYWSNNGIYNILLKEILKTQLNLFRGTIKISRIKNSMKYYLKNWSVTDFIANKIFHYWIPEDSQNSGNWFIIVEKPHRTRGTSQKIFSTKQQWLMSIYS